MLQFSAFRPLSLGILAVTLAACVPTAQDLATQKPACGVLRFECQLLARSGECKFTLAGAPEGLGEGKPGAGPGVVQGERGVKVRKGRVVHSGAREGLGNGQPQVDILWRLRCQRIAIIDGARRVSLIQQVLQRAQ